MKEVRDDFWKINGQWKCIPTNGEVYSNKKEAVMGAGLAKQASLRLIQFPKILWGKLQEGNHVYYIGTWDYVRYYSFPTKEKWKDPSPLSLIEQSCRELLYLLEKSPQSIVVLPQVGCGLGGLDYEDEVKPLLLSFFQKYDNVLISLGKNYG